MKIAELEIDMGTVKMKMRDVELAPTDLDDIRKTLEKISADQVEASRNWNVARSAVAAQPGERRPEIHQ